MDTYFEMLGRVTTPLLFLLAFVGAAVAAVLTATRSRRWRLVWISGVALSITSALFVSQGISPRDGLYVVLSQLGVALLALLSVAAVSVGAYVIASRFSSSRPVVVVASVTSAVLSAPLFLIVVFGVACALGECS